MKKDLDKIQKVGTKQVNFARQLGLKIKGDTVLVAHAKLLDIIDKGFWGKSLESPTEKQIELAKTFSYDIGNSSRRVAFAILNDIMMQLNIESIDNKGLKPGDTVINKWDKLKTEYIISSITEEGLVYFKGGQGRQAWARNLIKIEAV